MASDHYDDDDDYDDDFESVLFQGAIGDREVNLGGHAKLTKMALVPTKKIITDAIIRRALLLRINPRQDGSSSVKITIDGIDYPAKRLNKRMNQATIQMLKVLCGLDPKERKKLLKGGIFAEFQNCKYELEVHFVYAGSGVEKVIMYIQNVDLKLEKPDELGFSPEMKNKIRDITSDKSGVLLVCGSPFTGTTSTAFAVLRSVDAYLYSIFTVADMGTRDMTHITVENIREDEDFESAIKRVLRLDGDILFVDPLKTVEEVQTIFDFQNDICIISEFQAKNSIDGIKRILKWVEDPEIVASGLRGIITQRLLRVLCEECKRPYRPNPKLLSRVGLPPETKVLFRATSTDTATDESDDELDWCEHCGGIGYYGQMGIFELIEVTDEMSDEIANGADPQKIKTIIRENQMQTLQSEALRAVAEGKTSLEELQRIFSTM